jgi:hypothetical protein
MTLTPSRARDRRRPHGPPLGRALLAALAAGTGVAACVLAGTTARHHSSFTTVLIMASVPLAIAAAARPDTHISLGVVAVVVWAWLRANPDAATARTVVVAVALLAFHAAIAVLATTPSAVAPTAAVLRRWGLRTLWVMAGTIVVWLLVAALQDQRRPPSPTALSAAVLAVAAAALWARHRALAAARHRSPQLSRPGDAT